MSTEAKTNNTPTKNKPRTSKNIDVSNITITNHVKPEVPLTSIVAQHRLNRRLHSYHKELKVVNSPSVALAFGTRKQQTTCNCDYEPIDCEKLDSFFEAAVNFDAALRDTFNSSLSIIANGVEVNLDDYVDSPQIVAALAVIARNIEDVVIHGGCGDDCYQYDHDFQRESYNDLRQTLISGQSMNLHPCAIVALQDKATKPKEQRKGSRGGTASKQVLASVANSVAQAQGAADAALEIAKDNKIKRDSKDPCDGHLCFNTWAAINGKFTRDFTTTIHDNQIIVSGQFKWEDDEERLWYRQLHLPPYDGFTPIKRSTTCGTIFQLVHPPKPTTIPLLATEVLTNDSRLKNALLSTLSKFNPYRMPTRAVVLSNARANFCRHYAPYQDLHRNLEQLYDSQWWNAEYESYIRNLEQQWVATTENRLRHSYALDGETLERALSKFNPRLKFGLVNYYGRVVMLPAFHVYLVVKKKLYKLGQQTWESSYRKIMHIDHREQLRLLTRQMDSKIKIGMVPCALAALEKQTVDYSSVPTPIVFDGDKIHLDPDLTEPAVVNYVDNFGTYIDGPIFYPESNSANLAAAVSIRMLQYPGMEASDFVKFAKRFIDENLPVVTLEGIDQLAHLQATYGGKRGKRLYELSHEALELKHLVSSLFVKGEAYRGKTRDTAKPRMIWNRNEMLIAKFSHVFKELGTLFGKFFCSTSHHYYTSKSTPDSVGQFAARMFDTCPSVYESDVSNWDGSLGEEMLVIEKYLLETKVRGMPSEFDLVLDHWVTRRGVTRDGAIDITIRHGRLSGDLWTSLFNTILNIIVTAYVNECRRLHEFMIMALGDDNMVGVYKPLDRAKIEARYQSLGMKCSIIPRSSIEQATYCSGFFCMVGGEYRWSNLPFRVLSTLGLNHNGHPPHLYQQLLYGTAKSMLPTCGHVPIIGSILRTICSTAENNGIKARYDNRSLNPYRVQGGMVCYPDIDSYSQFERRYGIDPRTAAIIETYIEENFDIRLCPYRLEGLFEDGFQVDINLPTCENGSYSKADMQHFILDVIPRQEEMAKLAGASSFIEAMDNARALGAREDELAGTRSHVFLHMLFTTVSWANLEMGIALHRKYNEIALSSGRTPCAKGAGRRKNSGNQRKTNRNQPGLTMDDLRRLNALSLSQGIPRIRGQGGYVTDALTAVGKTIKRRTPKGTFKALGTAAGGAIGGAPGAAIGGLLGQGLSHIVGFGDYTNVKANSLLAPIQEGVQSPQFANYNHVTVITHTEFVTDITADGGTAFTIRNFAINPGLRDSFPWASLVTEGYETWQALGLFYEYRSTSSDITAGGPLGSVIMATSYDSLHASYADKVTMTNSEYSMTGKPSTSFRHYVECDPTITAGAVKYIRSGVNPTGSDERMYDLGNFQIATVGLPTSSGNIGELWVTYQIALYKPTLARKVPSIQDHFDLPTSVSSAHYMGADTTTTYDPTNNSPMGGYTKNSTYYFPAYLSSGRYLFMYKVRGAATTITTAFTATLTNLTAATFFGNGSSATPYAGWSCPQSGALSCTDIVYCAVVDVTAINATLAIAGGTLPGSISGADVLVIQMA